MTSNYRKIQFRQHEMSSCILLVVFQEHRLCNVSLVTTKALTTTNTLLGVYCKEGWASELKVCLDHAVTACKQKYGLSKHFRSEMNRSGRSKMHGM